MAGLDSIISTLTWLGELKNCDILSYLRKITPINVVFLCRAETKICVVMNVNKYILFPTYSGKIATTFNESFLRAISRTVL